ncbi:hypothetical protein TrRE_jg4000 [Triparma retinervis]|uniref:Branched-chain-amino-acid transaminase n=1 Tax=Triparma retinervis TaxID=2557542 RepID=A0A9W6Z8J1_9STRA|nr:hypothetical protein TrRE_jg4000 [Triparma retinervis]
MDCPLPGTAKLDVDWSDLGFELRNTKSHIKMTYKEGEGWGPLEFVTEPYIKLHIGATSLHYGQACFEGLKAFAHSDGSVHIFRPTENAARLQSSCERTMMPVVPHGTFVDACKAVVKDNMAYSKIEEFSTSNFIGIDNKNGKYITPSSPSVLPSITNKSLMSIALDEGLTVEQRDIEVGELKDFDECIACGTAVVVTPIGKVVKGDEVYNFGKETGETTMKLYNRVRDIQNGVEEDKFGWNVKVC